MKPPHQTIPATNLQALKSVETPRNKVVNKKHELALDVVEAYYM